MTTTFDRVDISSIGHLYVRYTMDDGTYFRECIAPGDWTRANEVGGTVATQATTTWTPSVVSAYEALID